MTIHSWNDKILYDDRDSTGYRLTEGDEGELIVKRIDNISPRIETDLMSLWVSDLSEAFLKELVAKYKEMSVDKPAE